jgi:hypothetical protein
MERRGEERRGEEKRRGGEGRDECGWCVVCMLWGGDTCLSY